ncbi:hypothetical protein B0T21DRAFT_275096, partial [Apiosordaria backusii]
MCRKYQRIGLCGHIYRQSWSPRDPRDCKNARTRARRNGTAARHCTQGHGGRSTVITADNTQICGDLPCYRAYILMPNGWTCHQCGGQNNANTRSCVHSEEHDYSSGSSS